MTSQSWPWLGKGQGLDPPRTSSSSQQVKTWLDTHIWVWATPNRIFHDLPKTNWWSNQFQTSCSSNLGMQSSVTFLWQWCLGQCWRACKVEVVRPNLILIHKRFEDVDSDSDIFFQKSALSTTVCIACICENNAAKSTAERYNLWRHQTALAREDWTWRYFGYFSMVHLSHATSACQLSMLSCAAVVVRSWLFHSHANKVFVKAKQVCFFIQN